MKSKKQVIIQTLKKEILDMTLQPGNLISEATLTDRFHISRTPIRDILKQLESEGYIKIYPKKGSIVSYIDLDSIEQIIFLRNTLEKEILKNLRTNFTIAMSHNLSSILKSQVSCIQDTQNLPSFLKQDDLFHQTCFKYAGREFLWEVIQQYNVHYLRYRNLNMKNSDKLTNLVDEHRLLLKYLQGAKNINIIELMDQHLKADLNSFEFAEKFAQYMLSYN